MVSTVVAETIQRTRHMTDADAEVNSLSAGRSGGLGNTDDQGREAVAGDRWDSDARPRSRIGASTFTSRRTSGCGDKGKPDACGNGSSPEGARGCRRDRTVRRPTVVPTSNRRETVTRIGSDGAQGESYNSARGTKTRADVEESTMREVVRAPVKAMLEAVHL